MQEEECDGEDDGLKKNTIEEDRPSFLGVIASTIRKQPLRPYFKRPMIMALFLIVEASPAKYTFIVKMLGVVTKHSRTYTTKSAEANADKCTFSLYISKRTAGTKVQWVVPERTLLLDHSHPTRTSSQKKLFMKLHLLTADLSMLLDLGMSFVPLRDIVEFTYKCEYHDIAAKYIHNLFDEHGYSSGRDAHKLLTAPDKNGDIESWNVEPQRDCIWRLSHAFSMSKKQITLARRLSDLLLNDSTYESNQCDVNVGLFVGLNNFGRSLLLAQAVVLRLLKTRGFEYQFSNRSAAIGMASVVRLITAHVKASNTAKIVSSAFKHL